jgi:hypothetical protein
MTDAKRRLFLLTATVTPHPGVRNLAIVAPEERFREYQRTLEFVAGLPRSVVAGVVFAENSGADLNAMKAVLKGRPHVELLSLQPRGVLSEPGRGYLETQLVADAFRASELIRDIDNPLVWKMTGRYQVRNIARIVAHSPTGMDLYFNLRRYPQRWADMWVYGTTRRGIALLSTSVERLREVGASAEREMYTIVSELSERGERVSTRLPFEPRIAGIRGYDGMSYGAPRQRAKWLARAIGRRVLPQLYI